MIEIKQKELCSGCEACVNICPKKCIQMEYDEEGFRYPKINKKECINCHMCEKICPILNKLESTQQGYKSYGAFNKNKKILKDSSSGGIFYELGKAIIKDFKGVVFGVKFDKDNYSIFDYAEDVEKLKLFMGSKYVQAKNNGMYVKVKEFLDNGRTVLFSGTPCQIAGLYSFLRKDYENLYTVDVICQGVPSEILVTAFKQHFEMKYKSRIIDIKFRQKKYGWRYFGFLITFESGKKIYIPRAEANLLKILFEMADSRPSCYDCKFRELKSGSDIKLADFWGVHESKNTKFNFNGVSHVIINNKKAENLLNKIKDNLNLYESSIEEVKRLNNSFNSQKFDNKLKKQFLYDIDGKSMEEIYNIMDEHIGITKLGKIKNRIKLKLVKIKYAIKMKDY